MRIRVLEAGTPDLLETVAQVYRQCGVDAFERLHGQFCLALGAGGNELFAGAARYGADKVFALYQTVPRPLRRLLEPLLAALPARLPVLDCAQRYVRRANIPNPRRLFSYNAILSEPLSDLLSPGSVRRSLPMTSWRLRKRISIAPQRAPAS